MLKTQKWPLTCVLFSNIVRILCSTFEIFGAISDKVSEKILLVGQQYACGRSVLINLTEILQVLLLQLNHCHCNV